MGLDDGQIDSMLSGNSGKYIEKVSSFMENFWTPVSNKELCKHLLTAALEEIGHQVDKRIHKNTAEYRKREKEQYLLNMFRKKTAKIGTKKLKTVQNKNFYIPTETGLYHCKSKAGKGVQKKRKNISKKKQKKRRPMTSRAEAAVVLENDFFHKVRGSLEFFAKKKKEFLLSVLTLYKDMEALDLTDLKTLLEMKFIDLATKAKQRDIGVNAAENDHESGDRKFSKELEEMHQDMPVSVREEHRELSHSSLFSSIFDQTQAVPPNSASSMKSSLSLDLSTEKGIDNALSKLIEKKTEIVKIKSKFNLSQGKFKRGNEGRGQDAKPESHNSIYGVPLFKRPPKKIFG